jgi:hypothetical protein
MAKNTTASAVSGALSAWATERLKFLAKLKWLAELVVGRG